MMVKCIKCGRERRDTFMQQAVFRAFIEDEKIPGIYKCVSGASCRAARKADKEKTELENLAPDSQWRYDNWQYDG